MTTLPLILVSFSFFALFVIYAIWRLKKAKRDLDQMFATVERLKQEKAVAETQVKHFETRKKHEESTRRNSRDDIIDRLQQQGDLRD